MEQVFITLLNTSITAGYLVLAVLLLRPVLKKAPKYIRCILWGLVGLRLVLPFSLESITSLIPNAQPIPPEIVTAPSPTIQTGVSVFNSVINPVLSGSLAPAPGASVNPVQILIAIGWNVWLLGVIALMLYSLISFLLLRRRLREAVRDAQNVWVCDRVSSPFLLGLFRPRIYLPSGLNDVDRVYVLAHENAHIRRKDHWWKPVGFLLLTVYWFNPLLWVAYIFLCRDIEFACDEKVIRQLGEGEKKPYSEALIHCSIPKKMISACPVAFGEDSVKGRIKSVLNYKKPAFWVILIAVIACIAVAVCFLTNPPKDTPDEPEEYRFEGTVIEIRADSLLIEPSESTEYFSGAKVVEVRLNGNDPDSYRLGGQVVIDFDGVTQELYPPVVPNARIILPLDFLDSSFASPEPDYTFAATVTEVYDRYIVVKYQTLPLHNFEYQYYRVNTVPAGISAGALVKISYDGVVTEAEPHPILGKVYRIEVLAEGGAAMDNSSILTATVLEIRTDSLLVQPADTVLEQEQKLLVMTDSAPDYAVGSQLAIYYNGAITMSDPPEITALYIADHGYSLFHTPASERQADRFFYHADESTVVSENYICYQEPDGCVTKIINTGFWAQPLMIYGERIYYQVGETVHAIDFSGNAVASIALPKGYYQGCLLYCDRENIYGAAGDNGVHCFSVDLGLTAVTELSAMPARYRQLDTEKLLKDMALTMESNYQDISVYKANVSYDSNGMVNSMLLAVSASHNGSCKTGNIIFSWYNNQKSYDEADRNPWYTPTDTVLYTDTENNMSLENFLKHITTLSMAYAEQHEDGYRYRFNGGIEQTAVSTTQARDFLGLNSSQGLKVFLVYDGKMYSRLESGSDDSGEHTAVYVTLEEMAVALSTYPISPEQVSVQYETGAPHLLPPEADADRLLSEAKDILFSRMQGQWSGTPVYTPQDFSLSKIYPVVIYAYQLGANAWRFNFSEDTTISGSISSAMYGVDSMDLENAKQKLAEYTLSSQDIPVIVINSYISSYYYPISESTVAEARKALGLT